MRIKNCVASHDNYNKYAYNDTRMMQHQQLYRTLQNYFWWKNNCIHLNKMIMKKRERNSAMFVALVL